MSLDEVYEMENPEKEQIISDIISIQSLADYEAFDALWVALTKAAKLMTVVSDRDCQGMVSLIEKFSDEEIKRLLKDESVDSLIFLDPPLETALADPDEEPDENSTIRVIGKIRSSRDSDPREALINLGEILKRIRNKRTHGYKTGSGSQDKEIFLLARKILYLLCMLVISKLN
ncbi:MAG: hypothetical protein SCARUB_02922 [Candidatus Scalindua rubra]|uniref:Apea-like HEPN domain-containing protein n=1 Tax=Candidatus Scalindua rubra TaxID=1872076 RepID=A0A1E3X8N9_9BACT|nr:MAG: hypothetical protein SCARUB_02922 [Candidatus Scalindua rubra]